MSIYFIFGEPVPIQTLTERCEIKLKYLFWFSAYLYYLYIRFYSITFRKYLLVGFASIISLDIVDKDGGFLV